MSGNAIPIASYIDKTLTKESKRAYTDIYGKEFQLTIHVSMDGFSFNVLDLERNKHLALVSYHLQEISDHYNLAKELDSIFDENELLKRYYPRVTVLYETGKSTLIPFPLFENSSIEHYLKFNHKVDKEEEIMYDRLANLEAYNVYAVSKHIKEKMREKFAKFTIVHHATTLLETLLITNKNQALENTVFVNFNLSNFDLVYIEGQKLVFYNSFRYKTREDFAYFLIFALEQLKLNPENVNLIFLGEIDKNSHLYDIAFKYLRNIEFIERCDYYRYSYVFDNIPSGYYYNLLNASQCEL